ncbi:insulin-like 5b [Denticeps clupeoides]|uniref:insulin-like 5b n=1 Tax=Denticeps clupeoides TaxID=299321 RepID=UPI0010A38099|nr:relaxin-3-like [Denticeps clupeoides]
MLLLAGGAEGASTGLRLCGREFLRAVVFTCGGSRWRRLLAEDVAAERTGQRRGGDAVMEPGGGTRLRRDQNQQALCCERGCSPKEIIRLC